MGLFIRLVFLVIACTSFSCSVGQTPEKENKALRADKIPKESLVKKPKRKALHPYGGWSCPDNLFGFPPVNAAELNKVPVVVGRLPTKEETRNGTSLMYFDTAEIPSAEPLDITLPQLARFYSAHTKKNEWVAVIQAVRAENDTVVGFRYLNGGNGSAWYDEVTFASEKEREALGATPFISEKIKIEASKERIWSIITGQQYAKVLGNEFDEGAFYRSEWKRGSAIEFVYEPDSVAATGEITALWIDTYLQIDYDFNGVHYAEKYLVTKDSNTDKTTLTVVAGPYGNDFEGQQVAWGHWMNKVKELSEEAFNLYLPK